MKDSCEMRSEVRRWIWASSACGPGVGCGMSSTRPVSSGMVSSIGSSRRLKERSRRIVVWPVSQVAMAACAVINLVV